jgi:hypothetical protein
MDAHRKRWNEQQQALKQALAKPPTHAQAIALCLGQHAAVHAAQVAQAEWSFEDEVWQGLSDAAARFIPAGGEHSIVWMVWHSTRIEDMTMNCLVAGSPQVIDAHESGWTARMQVNQRDTGNTTAADGISRLSAQVDLAALRAYRAAVGRRTQAVLQALTPDDVRRPVAEADLRALLADGSVAADAMDLVYYWHSLTVAGLLLMPATRHPFVHWNEALRVKKQALKGK